MTTPDPTIALTAELAHLREAFGQFGRDLGEIKTACAVLVERSNRTDADVRKLEEQVKELRGEVDALKERRFPLPVIGALATAGALLVSVIGLLLTR